MTFFDVLTLIGGMSLFLFGMNQMGAALERRAGEGLKALLGRLTTGKMAGFLTGLAVTAVIQSSSATTVMVVGFVNSGLMTLTQAINVIMGANVGTTATAWLISLTGIDGGSFWLEMLKPSSFTPILALIGIIMQMGGKTSQKKDTGMILLGFAVLMFGMDTMASAVEGLKDVPEFCAILPLFTNPILGVLAGALLTAIIQSSSASVGILQALASTGQITFGAAIPIIMGQNIGTCVKTMFSSLGTNRNARRAATVHLCFNLIGTTVWLTIFQIIKSVVAMPFLTGPIDEVGIAIVHSIFNILCTLLLLPMTGMLERLALRLIPEPATEEQTEKLDERLMAAPALAVERCRVVTVDMATISTGALHDAMEELKQHDPQRAESIRKAESDADHYEDILGTYLVKLSSVPMSDQDNMESAELLHIIGDFERISDHAVNLLQSSEELHNKGIHFSNAAHQELELFSAAINEILALTMQAFKETDRDAAHQVEPLEQVVDTLKEQLRSRHIMRLQRGECSIEAGFVWSDILTNLERVADHCSNIAGCVLELRHEKMDLHGYLDNVRRGSNDFAKYYNEYAHKYSLIKE